MSGIGKLGKLAMDSASRLSRAKDMGYMTDTPLYHGTGRDVEAFDLSRGGDVSGSPVGSLGVSAATDPGSAGEFASLAAGRPDDSLRANVLPLYHRAEMPVRIDLSGDEMNHEIAATVQDAWDQGFDAIKFTNYTTPGGQTGKEFVLVKNPNQLRSVNAAFDPEKKSSANLLAGVGGAAVGLGAAGKSEAGPTAKELIDMYNQKDTSPKAYNVPHPKMYRLADLIDEYTESPMGGSWFEGVTDWMRETAEGRDENYWEKYKRGLNAALDFL